LRKKQGCCCDFRKSMSSQIFVTTSAKLRLLQPCVLHCVSRMLRSRPSSSKAANSAEKAGQVADSSSVHLRRPYKPSFLARVFRSDSSGAAPATDNTVADSPSMPTTSTTATTAAPRRSDSSTNQPHSTGKCPLQPLGGLNEPPRTPLSTASTSQCH